MPTRPIPDDPTATSDTNHGDLLPLLLEICEDFLAHTGPATHHEVDTLLRTRGITGGPGMADRHARPHPPAPAKRNPP